MMTSPDSAVKESWSEAGVMGINDNPLGTYKYRKQGKIYNAEVFLLRVEAELSNWLETSTRVRQWLDVASAAGQVKPAALKSLLKTLMLKLCKQ